MSLSYALFLVRLSFGFFSRAVPRFFTYCQSLWNIRIRVSLSLVRLHSSALLFFACNGRNKTQHTLFRMRAKSDTIGSTHFVNALLLATESLTASVSDMLYIYPTRRKQRTFIITALSVLEPKSQPLHTPVMCLSFCLMRRWRFLLYFRSYFLVFSLATTYAAYINIFRPTWK